MESAYAEALAEGLPTNRVIAQQAMEAELRAMGRTEEAIADEMARRGVNPNVVTQVRTGNKWRDYGRLKAYAEMAGDGYGPWLEQQLNKLGPEAASPGGRAAAIQQLQQQYLKQNKLFGLSADFLGPMFSKMRTSSNGVIDAARRRHVVNSSKEMFEEARTTLYSQKTPDALNELFRAKAVGYDSNGALNGNTAGVDAVFTELESYNRYTDSEVKYLLENTKTDNGQTYAQRYGGRVNDLLTTRRNSADTNRGLIAREKAAVGKEKVEDAMTFFESQPGIDMGALDETINAFKQEGFNVSRLEALKYSTQQEVSKRTWEADLQRQWDNGTLTADNLKDVNIPQDVRYRWLDKVNKLDSARSASGKSTSTISTAFAEALARSANITDIGKGKDETVGLATAAAIRKYNVLFRNYSEVMDPGEAADRAFNEVYKEIDQQVGLFATAQRSSKTGSNNYFPSFAPKAFEDKPKWSSAQALADAVIADPSILATEELISKSTAEQVVRDAMNNGAPNIPPVLLELARKTGKSPTELLRQQTSLVLGKPFDFPPSAADTLKDQLQDPVLQEILNRPTPANVNTAILSSSYAGGYSSPDPRGQTLIAMSARNGWDPADIAAIISFETGGTLDPAQPGYGAAAGRVGLIQAGPNERSAYGLGSGNWNQEMKGIENYLLARGAKPGMGLEDLYSAVNGGNVNAGYTPDGNGTVPRSSETLTRLLEHKAASSVKLGITRTGLQPTRDPNNMTPTLQHFYTTGGETNGGWSEHTDIKQADNPNTVQDEWGQYFDPGELDTFIEFNDPEFGNITLSELRNRIPISGGNYGDPRSYGPHAGWDYGTKAGTKLYLKGGARVVASAPVAGNGVRTTIQLPDGRRFAFLHGKGV
jgi:hypothetical protein